MATCIWPGNDVATTLHTASDTRNNVKIYEALNIEITDEYAHYFAVKLPLQGFQLSSNTSARIKSALSLAIGMACKVHKHRKQK